MYSSSKLENASSTKYFVPEVISKPNAQSSRSIVTSINNRRPPPRADMVQIDKEKTTFASRYNS